MQLSWACIIRSITARLSRALCASLVASRLSVAVSGSDGNQAPHECLSSNKDDNNEERMMLAPRQQSESDNTVALVSSWSGECQHHGLESANITLIIRSISIFTTATVNSNPGWPTANYNDSSSAKSTTRNKKCYSTSHGHRRIVGIVAAIFKVEVALQSQSSKEPSTSSEQR